MPCSARGPDLPGRGRWLELNNRLSRRVIEAHREWIDEAEELLGEG
jgi:hypothetical protein